MEIRLSLVGNMTFAYHRSVAPMMWTLFAIAIAEAVVVHLVVALWHPWIAVGLSVLSIATLVWLIAAIRSFKSLPVQISGDTLVWRVGNLRKIVVPIDRIAEFQPQWSAAEIKGRDVLNCAMIAYPNTVLVLREPVPVGRRSVAKLAHRLDDPSAFASALGSLLRGQA